MNIPAEPRKAPVRWSPTEEAQLIESFKAGKSMAQMAEAHDRSIGAIQSRLHALDLIHYGVYTPLITDPTETHTEHEKSGTPWTEMETARLLVAHHAEGTAEALVTLAAELGRTPRSLALKLVHLGAVKGEPNPNPQPRIQAKEPKTPKKPLLVSTAKPNERTQKIRVTPEFQHAARMVADGHNTLILGSAGTGKSTFLRYLKKQLMGTGKRYVVLAPTGMAALNVGGQTIHSFFKFKPQILTPDNLPKPRQPKLYEKLNLLIIDEISMVRADIFEAIDRFLRKYGPKARQPFGGVQVVLMGDLFQLPPVVRNEENGYFTTTFETPYFFSSPSFNLNKWEYAPFTEVFRQSDAPFIHLLNQVRLGDASPNILNALNARVSKRVEGVILAARVRTVESINQRELAALPTFPKTYTAKTEGEVDAGALPSPEALVLKVGAHVMFTRNDTEQRWVNGTLGIVKACNQNSVEVEVTQNGSKMLIEVEPTRWELTKYAFAEKTQTFESTLTGTFTQLPLTLAWALTIHKAQGQTLPSCTIDLSDGGAFAAGQMYVALSRARSLESIHLTTPIKPRDIQTHPAVLAFYTGLTGISS